MKIVDRSQAAISGLKRYFTGKPCRHGHVVERRTDTGVCVACAAEVSRSYYVNNRAHVLAVTASWAAKNKDKKRAAAAARYVRNKEKIDAQNSEYQRTHREAACLRMKEFWDRNPHKRNAHRAKYKASVLRAIPPWADMSAIIAIYEEAARITRETGIPHEVDHIVPLQSEWVCGLHIAANLEIKTALENRKKSNLWWPDMPDFLRAETAEAA